MRTTRVVKTMPKPDSIPDPRTYHREKLLGTAEGREILRSQHTCMQTASSIGCRACDRGVPYPAKTMDELLRDLERADKAARPPAQARKADHVCPKCGYNAAQVISCAFEFQTTRDAPSLNRRLSNSRAKGHEYRRIRDAWRLELRAARLQHEIPYATSGHQIDDYLVNPSSWPVVDGKRRITIVRRYGGRGRKRDRDNLIGGMKPVIDAIVLEHLVKDDDERNVELHYQQVHVPDRHGLHFTFEILGTADA